MKAHPMLILLATLFLACTSTALAEMPWDVAALQAAPATHEAPGFQAPGVRALFYDSLPWKGKPTRAFAWLGIPEVPAGSKVPAMVLAHGGGGTAYDEWVRIWTGRGYAAIAMDLEGTIPKGEFPNRAQHEYSGPHRQGAFEDLTEPPEDQWYYHAVADIILANSLLRSLPEVDAGQVGLTGISWGGILSCTVAGVDERFKFVIPVYGCGFMNEAPVFEQRWKQLGPELTQRWHTLWDGASYLANAKMPMLWVNGANDTHFPLNIHSKSYNLVASPKTLSVRVGLGHSHPAGWAPQEIYAFADGLTGKGLPFPKLGDFRLANDTATAQLEPSVLVEKAELIYSTDVTDWVKAVWETAPAKSSRKTVSATVPANARACFLNITHSKGLVSSTPVLTVP